MLPLASSLWSICLVLGALSPRLSLSLPHKGGGDRVVRRVFVTHETCLRMALGGAAFLSIINSKRDAWTSVRCAPQR